MRVSIEMRALLSSLAVLSACNGSAGPIIADEPAPPGLAFRRLERSFAAFDVPIETEGGWRIARDGWGPLPSGCKDESYRHAYPMACAPIPGELDGRFDMVRVLSGREPLTMSVQAYPTAAPAETLFDDELARAGRASDHDVAKISGAKALVVRRTTADIGHHEEAITTFSKHLMIRWRVGGPVDEQPTIHAIAHRLASTIVLRP